MKTKQERIKAMTIQDIKKALEICADISIPCNDCPYDAVGNCSDTLCADALKLITEQEKEIERLKEENGQSRKLGILGNNVTVESLDDAVSKTSVDCKDIEKYAKQFCNRIISINEKEIKRAQVDVLNKAKKCSYCDNDFMDGKWHRYVLVSDIDKLIEEVKNGECNS